jgi:DNA ligase-1
MNFPILYGEASTGKSKIWSVVVIEKGGMGEITVTHGYEDGKMQINSKMIEVGKNIGKKNETTALQQAVSEARATWQKKKDAGYAEKGVSTESSSVVVATSKAKATTDDVPLPMLALDFNKRGSSIKFPCYVQRKYDGTRCIAVPRKGLYSRNRKRYPHMEHILEELAVLPSSIILDGELYSTDLSFQEIVGLVKRETLSLAEKQRKIEFHCYDIVSDAPYEDRFGRLQALFARFKFKHLKLVATEVCEKKEDLKALHDKYVGEGYEGIMVRNAAGLYKVGHRSADLQKMKEFEDNEYEVIDFKEGEGAEKGCVIWICKTAKGQTFACRPRGSREDRAASFKAGGTYIGKELTVRYQELTTDGLPRFPVGIAFRDYE